MKFNLNKRLVLITGASSGIGRSCAIEFSKKGAYVALIGRNNDYLKEVEKNIIDDDGCAASFNFDLNNLHEISELVVGIENKFNKTIDILVNCAGIAVSGLIEDVPLSVVNEVITVNTIAPMELTRCVLPMMKRKKIGQIINVSSGAGSRGIPGNSSYCASKFALNGWTESLRVEVRGYGIDVINYSPGPTNTNIVERTKSFGSLKNKFTSISKSSSEEIARSLVNASMNRKLRVDYSLKNALSCHLNMWFPSLIDLLMHNIHKKSFNNIYES